MTAGAVLAALFVVVVVVAGVSGVVLLITTLLDVIRWRDWATLAALVIAAVSLGAVAWAALAFNM